MIRSATSPVAGHDKRVLFGAFLELLLIISNIGTAVVIVPIMWRRYKELSIGYVTARLFECTFILVGIVAVLGIITLRNQDAGASEGTLCLHARSDQRLDLPSRPRVGCRVGERTDPRLHDVSL